MRYPSNKVRWQSRGEEGIGKINIMGKNYRVGRRKGPRGGWWFGLTSEQNNLEIAFLLDNLPANPCLWMNPPQSERKLLRTSPSLKKPKKWPLQNSFHQKVPDACIRSENQTLQRFLMKEHSKLSL